jgi:hypothetical protein
MWRILDKLSNNKLLEIHPVRCKQPSFFLEVDHKIRKCGLDFERHHFKTASCKLQNLFILTRTLIYNSRYPQYITQTVKMELEPFQVPVAVGVGLLTPQSSQFIHNGHCLCRLK